MWICGKQNAESRKRTYISQLKGSKQEREGEKELFYKKERSKRERLTFSGTVIICSILPVTFHLDIIDVKTGIFKSWS